MILGCRQGDPIASYIFILCAEVLAIRLRNNKNIPVLNISNCPILPSQYADDTSLMLDGTEISLRESIDEINAFTKCSGLKINFSKTRVIWIGSKRYSSDSFLPEHNLEWGRDRFTLLGIEFSVNLYQIPKLNFDKKLIKLKSLIKSWSRRTITPIGRIHVIKSLLISQFNHLIISLPTPDEQFLNKLNSILFNYLWNSSVDKVKRDVIVQQYNEGGLKMVNLKAFRESVKLSWIMRLYQITAKWQLVLKTFINIDLLTDTGNHYFDVCLHNCKNPFWRDVLKAWAKMRELDTNMTKGESLKTPVWHNKNICVANKSIFYKDWKVKGVNIINDFIKNADSHEFYTFHEFSEKPQIKTNFLNYHSTVAAIKKFLCSFNLQNLRLEFPMIPVNIEMFIKSKKGITDFYNILNKNNTIPTGMGSNI